MCFSLFDHNTVINLTHSIWTGVKTTHIFIFAVSFATVRSNYNTWLVLRVRRLVGLCAGLRFEWGIGGVRWVGVGCGGRVWGFGFIGSIWCGWYNWLVGWLGAVGFSSSSLFFLGALGDEDLGFGDVRCYRVWEVLYIRYGRLEQMRREDTVCVL